VKPGELLDMDEFVFQRLKISKQSTNMINSILLDVSDGFITFGSKKCLMDAVLEYQKQKSLNQFKNRKDYSALLKSL
jgi:hypothetical protein